MIIYEVNLEVERGITDLYAHYLPGHIREVVQLGEFKDADWYQLVDDPAKPGKTLWTIHYHAESREKLDAYLNRHAPRLRSEAVEKFGDKFTAWRRIMVLKGEF